MPLVTVLPSSLGQFWEREDSRHRLSSNLNRLFSHESARDIELGKLCSENPHAPLNLSLLRSCVLQFWWLALPIWRMFCTSGLRVFCLLFGCLKFKNNSKVQRSAVKQTFKPCACLCAKGVSVCLPFYRATVCRDDWTPNVEQIQAGSCLWCLYGPHPKGRLMESAEPSSSESHH